MVIRTHPRRYVPLVKTKWTADGEDLSFATHTSCLCRSLGTDPIPRTNVGPRALGGCERQGYGLLAVSITIAGLRPEKIYPGFATSESRSIVYQLVHY